MSGVRIRIERPLRDPEWRSRRDSIELNQERFDGPTLPLTIFDPDGKVLHEAPHTVLPFADQSVDLVEVRGVVEYVRDDRTFLSELRRIVSPGGNVLLRVPNAGPVAGFDGLNLYRYIADVSRRGVRIPEVQEVGFRRHYSRDDLIEALGPEFGLVRSWTTGTGLSELIHAAGLASLTLTQRSADRYLPLRPGFLRLIRIDQSVPVPGVGFWRWIEAIRR